MTAPGLDLGPAVEAAAQAMYESHVAQYIKGGGRPVDYAQWEDLQPIVRHNHRNFILTAVVAATASIAQQAWEFGAEAGELDARGQAEAVNPWLPVETDWDEALKNL